MSSKNNNKKGTLLVRTIVFVVLACIMFFSLVWQENSNVALGLKVYVNASGEIVKPDNSGNNNNGNNSGGNNNGDNETGNDNTGDSNAETVNTGDMVFHFVDVGQGDATIIELPDNKTMLIDAGSGSASSLLAYIKEEFVDGRDEPLTKFDYMMLTHSDKDHSGGINDVLAIYPADVFYRPNELASYSGYTDPGKNDLFDGYASHNTLAYKNAIDCAYTYCDTVMVTDATDDSQDIYPGDLSIDDDGYYSITLYTPIANNYNDYNAFSPIMVVEYQGKRVALSGDAESIAEAEFVSYVNKGEGKFEIFDDNYTVDVIKLGHHGSNTSSSTEYIEAITSPSNTSDIYTIASCGLDNSYGHPHQAVYDRLEALGFKDENNLRTDLDGDIVISIMFDDYYNYYDVVLGDSTSVASYGTIASISVSDEQELTLISNYDNLLVSLFAEFGITLDWTLIVIGTTGILFLLIVILPSILENGVIHIGPTKRRNRKRRW